MIRCYAGLLGQGKTVGMVADALEVVKRERIRVFTNMVGLKFPEAVCLADLSEISYVSNGLLLLDEAAVCVPSRFFQGNAPDVLSAFRQSRKARLDLWYTSQHQDDVDKVLRELTNEVVISRRMGSWYMRVRMEPKGRTLLGRRLQKIPKVAYALYDTEEVIGRHGGGGVVRNLLTLGPPSYARVAVRPGPGAGSVGFVGQEVFDRPVRRWYDRTGCLTREARAAETWLRDRGFIEAGDFGPHVVDLIRYELRRRAWLSAFGFGPDECDALCSWGAPWAEGYSPEEVHERRRVEEEETAARTLAVKRAAANIRGNRENGVQKGLRSQPAYSHA